MLISRAHRKVVLNLKSPERVTTVIPTAKVIQYKGRPLVAVPHRHAEVKILRNLGFKVPSPVRYYYEWPSRFPTRFAHQETTTDFLTSHRRAFCLNDMGTMKTLSTLWAYDFLRAQGVVQRMLVLSPLSTLERTWGDEIFRNFPHLNFHVLHADRAKRLKMLADTDVDIYIINHDGIKLVMQDLATRPDINLIVVDECASFRNASTDRWKALNAVLNKQLKGMRWGWGLTGTPVPNSPTDAWAQCRLFVPENVPEYFGRFREATMRQVTQFKWVARDNALDVVHQAMQPSIRYAREDCVDLPPTIYETRHVDLSREQDAMYKVMVAKMRAEYAGGTILAANEAVKANKLVQIACGVAYDTEGNEVCIPADNRVAVVKEIIDQAAGKVIVFVPLTGALNHVAEALRKDGVSVAVIHGGTPKNERDTIFREFQQEATPRVIVAQPGTMSHGLTLTAANTVVWFAPVTSNETFQQAIARVTRPGQKLHQLIVMIEGTEIERRIYKRLEDKTSVQSTLLDMLKEGAM